MQGKKLICLKHTMIIVYSNGPQAILPWPHTAKNPYMAHSTMLLYDFVSYTESYVT